MLHSEPRRPCTGRPSMLVRHGMPSTLEMAFIENAGAGAVPALRRESPSPALHPAPWGSGYSGPEPPSATSTASLLNAPRGKTRYNLALVLASGAACALIWAMVFVAAINRRGGDLRGTRTDAAEKGAEGRLPLEYFGGRSAPGGLSNQGNVRRRQPSFEVGGRRSSRSSTRSGRTKTTAYYKNLDDVREWTIDITDGTSDGSVTSWSSEHEGTTSERPFVKRARRRGAYRRRFESRTPVGRLTKSRRHARVHTQRRAPTVEVDDVDSGLMLAPDEGSS